MHELGILSSMLKTIEGIMKEENLSHVSKIVLQVGEISGVLPHYIEECYPAAIYKTPFEDMKMEMEIVPGIVRCRQCGKEFNAVEMDLRCPCGSVDLEPLSGREFMIKEIEAY